jgi:drug/metabolite transporter (DMT)-like permease
MSSPKPDNLPLAVGTILFTVFAMSAGDALIKSMGAASTVGLWQLFAVRSFLVLPLLLAAGLYFGVRASLLPKSILWVSLRAALLVMVWIAYYAALPNLPLSAAAAALYTLPLFIVGFSALWTHDRVTPLQGVAAVLGFIGVALVLRPGTRPSRPMPCYRSWPRCCLPAPWCSPAPAATMNTRWRWFLVCTWPSF